MKINNLQLSLPVKGAVQSMRTEGLLKIKQNPSVLLRFPKRNAEHLPFPTPLYYVAISRRGAIRNLKIKKL